MDISSYSVTLPGKSSQASTALKEAANVIQQSPQALQVTLFSLTITITTIFSCATCKH